MKGRVIVHFDGLCEPRNPGGVATYGVVAYRDGVVVHEEHGLASEPGPDSTNNVAEYTGLHRALEWVIANAADEPVVVRGDSQLAVRQMTGQYAVNAPRIVPLHAAAVKLWSAVPKVTFEWVKRDLNEHADRLSKKAYEEALAANPHWSNAKNAPASPKQKAFLEALGVTPPEGLTKREASKLIDRALDAKQQRL